MKTLPAKYYAYFIIAIISALFALSLSACHTIKRTSVTRDSVVLKDSTVYVFKTVTNTKDSIRIKDSVVKIYGSAATLQVPVNSTVDVSKKSGKATITRTVDNGVETITANCDSFEILVPELRYELHVAKVENDNLKEKVREASNSHSEVITKEVKKSRWAMFLSGIWSACAVFGIISLAYLLLRFFIK